ncbi:adhesin-like protein [Methanobrevibacter ruminantium M1]|uniref:Adhesin-like protein n=1 Tax=Methanobrevibacter ruminantium (strain ATCC 35063 / DSM 1093 / JCM 13430 / OCM 146 / M1) TaxID=634498 RepID=D3E4V6_METRM|nr:Ig-like domain repeat protein [Methanobrevibacter ruminantium]ADC47500.1 adhesin-like protein [Methanobrevibacter ruminantium M1]
MNKSKKTMIMLIMAILVLLTMASVSASELEDIQVTASNGTSDAVIASEANSAYPDNAIITSEKENGDENIIATDNGKIGYENDDKTIIATNGNGGNIGYEDDDNTLITSDKELNALDKGKYQSLSVGDYHSFEELQTILNQADGGETIELNYDYSLGAGGSTLKLTKGLTINGNNHTLYGVGLDRILYISSLNTQPIILNDIIFKDGGKKDSYTNLETNWGGAIYYNPTTEGGAIGGEPADFIINNCTFENNGAVNGGGAIFWNGSLKIIDSRFFNNEIELGSGGAVYANGNLTAIGCSFSNNRVRHGLIGMDMLTTTFTDEGYWAKVIQYYSFYSVDVIPPTGGAIFCNGTCKINDSSFDNNQAGEANEMGTGGGAIHSMNDITVCNSTFTNNKAYDQHGGAILCNRSGFIYNSTFRNNVANVGGAISCFYYLNAEGSTFSNNGGEIGTTWMDEHSFDFLIDNFIGSIPIIGDIYGALQNFLDLLGVESVDVLTGQYFSVGGALYTGLDCNVDKCTFERNHAAEGGGAIYSERKVTAKNSAFSSNKVFRGDSAVSELMSSQGKNRDGGAIHAENATTIRNSEFSGNSAPSKGGAVYCAHHLEMSDSSFLYNTAYQNGGALYADTIGTISNTKFSGNSVTKGSGDGGAVYIIAQSDARFESCEFSANTAESDGGAIYIANSNSLLRLNKCTFIQNIAHLDGGAFNCRGKTEIKNSVFKRNSVDGDGQTENSQGGAAFSKGDMSISDSSFEQNMAKHHGGAAYTDGKMTVKNSNFTVNSANNGGAIYASVMNDEVTNSIFKKNTGTNGDGGAIYINDKSWPKFDSCVFSDNKCVVKSSVENSQGGAIYVRNDDSELKVTNSNFTGNAAGQGGAIFSGKVNEITNSVFKKNGASKSGGAVYIEPNCNPKIRQSVFEENVGGDKGGAVYLNSKYSYLELTGCNFTKNTAKEGGGVYAQQMSAKVSSNRFISNKATDGKGGGIYVRNYHITETVKRYTTEFVDCTFTSNTCTDNGGGLCMDSTYSVLKITSCNFTSNTAKNNGGGVWAHMINSIQWSSFSKNKATEGKGGGVHIKNDYPNRIADNPKTEVKNCQFDSNTCKDEGGGLHVESEHAKLTLTSSTFRFNSAGRGGGVYAHKVISINSCGFHNNSANYVKNNGDGGAIYIENDNDFEIKSCRFEGNTAKSRGGAIYMDSYEIKTKISYSTFVDNYAGRDDHSSTLYTFMAGHSVFTKGTYTNISLCWFGSNNPSFTEQLVDQNRVSSDKEKKPSDFGAEYLKINIKINNTRPIAGNPYKVTVYFTGNVNNNVVSFSSNTLYHSTGKFGGDGTYSNIKADKNDMTADVVLTPESRQIWGQLDHQKVYLNVNPLTKNSTMVEIRSCEDIKYPDALEVNYTLVNYTISNAEAATYIINDSEGNTVKSGNLTSPETLYVEGLKPGTYSITITIPETYYYLSSNATASFDVFKGDIEELRIVVNNRTYPEEVKAIVYASVDEDYEVTIGEETKTVTVIGGIGQVNFGSLETDTYEATVSFGGSDLYEPISNATEFTVYPEEEGTNFEIDTNASEITYGASIKVTHKLPEDATGTIKYYLNNGTVLGELPVEEKLTLDLDAGYYVIFANYSGDESFEPDWDSADVLVKQVETEFHIGLQQQVISGNPAYVTHSISEGATGTISYYLSNGTFLGEVQVGETYVSPKWKVGIYNITANYSGDRNFVPASDSMEFRINPDFSFDIYLDEDDVIYGQTTTVRPSLPYDATGTVEFYYNDTYLGKVTIGQYEIIMVDGEEYYETPGVELPEFDVGVHEIVGKYLGDKNYDPAIANVRLTVLSTETVFEINASPSEIKYGEAAAVIHKLPSLAVGTILYYLSDGTSLGELYYYEDLALPKLAVGSYEILANYSGDENFNNASASTTLTINKADPDFEIYIAFPSYDFGDSPVVFVNLPDDATGNISYYLSDGTFLGELPVDERLSLPILNVGTHTIIGNYSGDGNYNNASASMTVTVNEVSMEFNLGISAEEISYGETATVTHRLPSLAKGNITYYLSDGTLLGELPVSENLTLPKLDVGTYIIIGNYSGDENFDGDSANVTLTVIQADPAFAISISAEEAAYGETVTVSPALPEDATGTVIYYLSNGTILGELAADENLTLPTFDVDVYDILANYSGDKNYLNASAETALIVSQADPGFEISISAEEAAYGETVTASPVLPEDATGTVIYYLSNGTILGELPVDESLTLPTFDVGTYTILANYSGDSNYLDASAEKELTLIKADSTLEINDIAFDYSKTGSAEAKTSGAEGIVASVAGHDEAVVEVNGNEITVSGLDAGSYTLSVSTIVDDNHNSASKNITVTVKKIDSSLSVEGLELDYGESGNVDAAAEGATGISAKIGSKSIGVNGYSIPISGLDAGKYNLTVTTIPDRNHNPVTKTAQITVNKIDSTLEANDMAFDYEGTGTSSVTYTGATGVKASVIGQPNAKVNVKGKEISVSGLDAGNYTLEITTIPDKNHKAVSQTVNVTVNKIDSKLDFNNLVDYGSAMNVTVKTEGASGIMAEIDGKELGVDKYTIPISALDAGEYDLTVTTIPNSNHNPVSKTVKVTITKLDSELAVEDLEFDYNSTGTTNATFEGATGITAKVVGQPNATVEINGNSISVSGLKPGSYTLEVTTVPDENHNPVTAKSAIRVNKLETAISANDISTVHGADKNLTAIIRDINGNPVANATVSVSLNGSKKYVSDSSGQISIPLKSLAAGNYTATISFAGTEIYGKSSASIKVAVDKEPTSIAATNVNTQYGLEDYITAVLKDGQGNPLGGVKLNVDLDGNRTIVTDSNGQIKIATKDLTAGNYIATISFAGNGNYMASESNAIVNINRTGTRFNFKNMTTTAFDYRIEGRIGKYFYFQLVDEDGNPLANKNVCIGFNGVKYNRTTNETGWTKLQINLRCVNLYTFAVTFSGDDNYTGAFNVAMINVTHQSPKLTAGNKSYKASANTKTLTAKFKSFKGTAIVGKKITFTVNGKKYSAITDKKGIATVNVSLNKKGTYKYTAAFAGDSTYKKVSVTSKLTIK